MAKTTFLFSLLSLFFGLPTFAFDAQGDVSELNKSIDAAADRGDAAGLRGLLTDDFQFILRSGTLLGKKDYLDSLNTGKMLRGVQHEVVKTRVYGDSVILTLKSSSPGAKQAWYTVRVFVRQGGAWKLASAQATAVAAP